MLSLEVGRALDDFIDFSGIADTFTETFAGEHLLLEVLRELFLFFRGRSQELDRILCPRVRCNSAFDELDVELLQAVPT